MDTTIEFNDSGLSEGTVQLYAPNDEAAISLHAAQGDEMIRVTKQGFYVRGVRVPVDDQEAETVYNAFKQWLTWANLQQR
jgi:hypothetical protein